MTVFDCGLPLSPTAVAGGEGVGVGGVDCWVLGTEVGTEDSIDDG